MLNSVKPMLMCAIAAMGLLFGSCSGDKSDEPNSEKDTKVSFLKEYPNPDKEREKNYNASKSAYDKLFETAWVLSTVDGKTKNPVGSRPVITFRSTIATKESSNTEGYYECFSMCGRYPDSWSLKDNKLYLFTDIRFSRNRNQTTPDFIGAWYAFYECSLSSAEFGVPFELSGNKLTIRHDGHISVFTKLDYSDYTYGGYENNSTYRGYLSNLLDREYSEASAVPDVGFVDFEFKGTRGLDLRFRIHNISSCGWISAVQVNYGTRYLVERKEASWSKDGYVTVTLYDLEPATVYQVQCHVKNDKGVGSSVVVPLTTSF